MLFKILGVAGMFILPVLVTYAAFWVMGLMEKRYLNQLQRGAIRASRDIH